MLEITITDVKTTCCAKSVRIGLPDGYHFFHPSQFVDFYGELVTIHFTEDWSFRLIKSEKKDGEWVDVDVIQVVGEMIKHYVTDLPLLHKPEKLEPLDNVEPLQELLDE